MNRRQRKKIQRRLADASLSGDPAAAARLLRAGAEPDTPALYLASVQGEAAIVRLLLEAGAAPDAEAGEGMALCAASAWGHTAVIELLLAYGADPELREDHGTGRTPAEWAQLAHRS